jgi:hypothetical protein
MLQKYRITAISKTDSTPRHNVGDVVVKIENSPQRPDGSWYVRTEGDMRSGEYSLTYAFVEPIAATVVDDRKRAPLWRGCFAYFPKALAAIAELGWGDDEESASVEEDAIECVNELVSNLLDKDYVYAAAWALSLLHHEIDGNAEQSGCADDVDSLLKNRAAALLEISRLSLAANEQHNPGQPIHWAREKSTDHADCLMRHLLDRGTRDTDGQLHTAKVAWRALAMAELHLEGKDPINGK